MTDSAGIDDDDAAVRWATRLDGEPLSDDEQSELEAWLTEKPRRRGTLLRAEAALAYLDRGRALAGHETRTPYDPRMGRRAFLVGGSFTGLTAASVLGFLLFPHTRPLEIQTAIGEVRRVPLPDGSFASINTSSRVAVAVADKMRNVTLEDGEAWFQVAHDKTRPFIVEAGKVRVQAVGTAFSVRRREDGADVLVTEGIVEAWVVGHEENRARIAAGSKSFVTDGTMIEVTSAPSEIERQLAWRTGELVLNGESLNYAVLEFNRYNRRKLVVGDADLGGEPLVGYFRTDQPEQFGQATAKLLGARAIIGEDTIVLTR